MQGQIWSRPNFPRTLQDCYGLASKNMLKDVGFPGILILAALRVLIYMPNEQRRGNDIWDSLALVGTRLAAIVGTAHCSQLIIATSSNLPGDLQHLMLQVSHSHISQSHPRSACSSCAGHLQLAF
jgi:hypothetical protein